MTRIFGIASAIALFTAPAIARDNYVEIDESDLSTAQALEIYLTYYPMSAGL